VGSVPASEKFDVKQSNGLEISPWSSTFLPTALVFDLEFEGHAIGMRRRNLAEKS